jgi:tetratricopeptide (TPR) repeat protein
MNWLLQIWHWITAEKIVVGVVLAAIVALAKFFGKSLWAGIKRAVRGKQPPPQPPHVTIEVKVPPPLPPVKPPEPQPAKPERPVLLPPPIPRPPAVGFVARRDKEGRNIVDRLKEELAPGKDQLIALWGPGGVGKTALAAEAVRPLAGVGAQHIVWTSAEKRADFNHSTLLDEIATQLGQPGLRQLALDPKKERVRDLLGAAAALVVLDNFETITPQEEDRCAAWLAQGAPCPALITSREKVSMAHNIAVDAMSPCEATEFVKRLVTQAGNPDNFRGLDCNCIIQAAEANPLLMEWVVAQIDLAQAPATVLAELAQGKGDAAQRVFDRSFNLPQVGDDGRATLLALSLFVPSASRPALAGVAGFDGDVARLNEAVKHLAALRLLGTSDEGRRLTLEGLTRELARARLSQDRRADEFRRRFVAYFQRYAQGHAEKTAEHFNALEPEKDNVLSAMDVAFQFMDWNRVMAIRSALEEFLDLRGYWDEAIRAGEQAVAAAREANDDLALAAFSGNVGTMRQGRGEYPAAKTAHQEALEAFRKLGSEKNVAVALHQLGMLGQDQGDLAEARRLYQESLAIKKKLGDQSGIATSLGQLGTLAQAQGNPAEARRLYEESLAIKKNLGDQSGIAKSLHQLGRVAEDEGDLAEARRLYEESLAIDRNLGDQSGIAKSLHQLGMLAQRQGKLPEARRLYEESLAIHKKLGDQSGIASSLHQLGMLAQDQGKLAEARRLYQESLEIARKLGDQSGIALSLGQLGRLAETEGDKAEAARLYREALGIFEKLKSPDAEKARRHLAGVAGSAGNSTGGGDDSAPDRNAA